MFPDDSLRTVCWNAAGAVASVSGAPEVLGALDLSHFVSLPEAEPLAGLSAVQPLLQLCYAGSFPVYAR